MVDSETLAAAATGDFAEFLADAVPETAVTSSVLTVIAVNEAASAVAAIFATTATEAAAPMGFVIVAACAVAAAGISGMCFAAVTDVVTAAPVADVVASA